MRDAVAVCSPGCAAVLTPDEGMRLLNTSCRGEELIDTLPSNAADLKCRKPADRFMRRDRVSASAASEVSGDRDAAASCSESLN